MIVKIYESKSGVKTALVFSLALLVCGGFAAKALMGFAAYLAMAVGAICLLACIKKFFQKDYVQIGDDNLVIAKGKESLKIKFDDISSTQIKTINQKHDIKALFLNFKKKRLNSDEVFKFLRVVNENEAILAAKYDKSIYEICNILKSALKEFNSLTK